MKVHFERTGGFAGLRTSISLDTDEMSPSESERIHDMCNNINFSNPPRSEPTSGAADLFHYKITVESKDGKKTIETSDLSLTPEFEDLINFLSDKAQEK